MLSKRIKVRFSDTSKIASLSFFKEGRHYTVYSKHELRGSEDYFSTQVILWNTSDRLSGVTIDPVLEMVDGVATVVVPSLKWAKLRILEVFLAARINESEDASQEASSIELVSVPLQSSGSIGSSTSL